MPAPMMQPIPSAVRLTGPRVLPSAWPSPSAMMSARGFRVIKPWGSGLGVKAWSVIETSLVSVDCCLRLRRDLVLRLARMVMKTPYNNYARSDASRRDAVDRIHTVRFETGHRQGSHRRVLLERRSTPALQCSKMASQKKMAKDAMHLLIAADP